MPLDLQRCINLDDDRRWSLRLLSCINTVIVALIVGVVDV
jgi:hypothetical protein